jgi:hypothetical protein
MLFIFSSVFSADAGQVCNFTVTVTTSFCLPLIHKIKLIGAVKCHNKLRNSWCILGICCKEMFVYENAVGIMVHLSDKKHTFLLHCPT